MLKFPRFTPSVVRRSRPALIEGLESRCLLSAAFPANPGFHFPGGGTPTGGDFQFHHNQYVVGTVVSVDTTADTITLSNPFGGSSSPTTYNLASAVTITANGASTTLGSLLAGANVALQLSTDTSTGTTTVTSITATNQFAGGVISSVDATADTITLTGFDGVNTTYPLASTATVKLDGSASTLGALVAGDSALFTLSALDGKTVTAITARSADQSGQHGVSQHVRATVVSVDTTADTITVSTTSGGSTVQKTYTVDPSATITADGTATPLSTLLAGAQVILTVSSSSLTTVTSIAAYSQQVSGKVTAVDPTANTITLADHGANTTTYTLGSSAVITLNGTSATLSQITTGSQAQLTLSAFDGTTVTDIQDHVAPVISHVHPINATVVSVNTTADTITVSAPEAGSTTQSTYTLAPSATITADGMATPLSSLLAGAHVLLTISASAGSATTVTSIAAFSQEVRGIVGSVDTTANTITIMGNGKSMTYTLGSSATITLNGAVSTLSALTAGTRASLTLSALDGSTVTAIQAITAAAVVHHRRVVGTVAAGDATAGTITVSSTSMGSTMSTTYTLGTGAKILANGAATTLASLLPGAHVVLQLTIIGTTITVNSIAALSQHVFGTISGIDATANTITLAPRDGGTVRTFTVGSGAVVMLNGVSSSLANLMAGQHVQLTLSALDGATVLTIRAHGAMH